jgi:flagellar hook-basal body complex protein FliE
MEMKRTMSEKATTHHERERKLKETKFRYESQTEGFKQQLSEKLDKINQRVSLNFF